MPADDLTPSKLEAQYFAEFAKMAIEEGGHESEEAKEWLKKLDQKIEEIEMGKAPQWWKDDPDASWQQFLDVHNQMCQSDRISSNIEFQRNWYMRALGELGIMLPAPHPEHPESLPHSEARLLEAKEVLDLAEQAYPKETCPVLSLDEMGRIFEALQASGVDRPVDRLYGLIAHNLWGRLKGGLRGCEGEGPVDLDASGEGEPE